MPWAKIETHPRFMSGSINDLCRRPYPGHPHGCPNFAEKAGCPPILVTLAEVIHPCHPVYVIFNSFPLGEHVDRMKKRHPDWTDRQLYCCLYWQGRARKKLRKEIEWFLLGHKGLKIIQSPEAFGVNVTATMDDLGVKLEWPPRTTAYQVVLAGRARKE